jgi:hypothetical protein
MRGKRDLHREINESTKMKDNFRIWKEAFVGERAELETVLQKL